MLYDPKWNETKADPLTLSSFISWLEKQPAKTRYDWMDCQGGCLLGQYLTAVGKDSISDYREMRIAVGNTAYAMPWTFGAALARARALVS